MSVINTNVKSIVAQNALTVNNRAMAKTMEQLSTGKRINSASDDAAGLAIGSKMTSQIKGLNQAVRNANDGISLIQVAEGSLVEVSNMMQRMRELSVQSANDTYTEQDRTALNLEFQELKKQINQIGNNTQWNGTNILDKSFASSTGEFKFQVGANADQTISLSIGDFRTTKPDTGTGTGTIPATPTVAKDTAVKEKDTLTLAGIYNLGDKIEIAAGANKLSYTVVAADLVGTDTQDLEAIATKLGALTLTGFTVAKGTGATVTLENAVVNTDNPTFTFTRVAAATDLADINSSVITSQANSNSAIAAIDKSLAAVNNARAQMGATINRLTSAADNLTNVSQNTSESRSRIMDTDYAQSTTELARTQIISQAATAIVGQAHQAPQSILSILH
jgi:flagellin